MGKIKKIDLHLHLGKKTMHSEQGFISSYEDMLPHLDELGIEKGVLMASGEDPKFPFGSNADNMAIANAMPERYAWACNLDYHDIDTVPERLRKYKEQGAVSIGELMINRPVDDPFLQCVYQTAGELKMPVTFHMSPEVGYSYGIVDDPGLPRLEAMLAKYKDTIFLGHSQTFWIEMSGDAPTKKEDRNQWGKGPIKAGGRVPELFAKYPNLCGDLSANSAGCAIMRDPSFGLMFLETYQDRLFFATDMVNVDMTFPLGQWLDEQAANGNLSEVAYYKICRGNAERVLGL